MPFLESDADLTDFFFPNGSFAKGKYECLSYSTDNKKEGDGSSYLTPPGTLPQSETQGLGELEVLENCFSNAPNLPEDYISRPVLEAEIKKLTADDRHPVITLLGRGGIGKTSLALKVLGQIAVGDRFNAVIWFSARDVDLQFTGPRRTCCSSTANPRRKSRGRRSSGFTTCARTNISPSRKAR